jgi:hypothetical protein
MAVQNFKCYRQQHLKLFTAVADSTLNIFKIEQNYILWLIFKRCPKKNLEINSDMDNA